MEENSKQKYSVYCHNDNLQFLAKSDLCNIQSYQKLQTYYRQKISKHSSQRSSKSISNNL